jgi:RNA 2',3'-cyclic 3'-phosphodiesterase
VSRLRLFVAAWPPPAVMRLLDTLARPEMARLRWTEPETWHVTLRFLGSTEREPVEEALRDASLPIAEARLGPASRRLGRGALVVPVTGLDELAGAVVTATAELGRPPEARGFHGHLTLARARDRVPAELINVPLSARWTVDEVALVASTLHPHGARYEVVARFPAG